MSFFSRKKNNSKAPSTSAPANGLASSQQLVSPWSAHAPPSRRSLAPLRGAHSLSTSAIAASELLLFGGSLRIPSSQAPSNDLYTISTRDFSTTLLQTSGDVPSPRYGHCAVLTSVTLLVWGGTTELIDQNAQDQSDDSSLYLLNLVSREWTRVVVNGPGPGGRHYHTMTLVGSKLFVVAGRTDNRFFNDIWALDLNGLKSKPRWERYEPAPGNEKPLPRAGHVLVTTRDRIIIFGGWDGQDNFNDTWSFNISTRKWTKLQCTGSIPSPRRGHAAVVIEDVMYVFGGCPLHGDYLDDLTALNLSTQRWTAFQDIRPSPGGRTRHAMACDGTRVFMVGGLSSPGARADETKFIHVLDTKILDYPEPDSGFVNPSETTTREQNDDGEGSTEHLAKLVAHDAPFGGETARLEDGRLIELERQLSETLVVKTERDRRIAQLTDELALKSALLEQAEANAAAAAAAAEAKKNAELELRKLQAKLDELQLFRDQAEANAVEAMKHARLEQRGLQAKLGELLLSRDQAEASAKEEKKRAGLEQRKLQEKLDESQVSRDQALEHAQSALQKASFRAAETNEPSQPICEHETVLAELLAKFEAKESELAAVRLRLADTENGCSESKSKAEADTYRTPTATGLVNTDVERFMHRLMERMRTMEAEVSLLRGNEKSIEEMECRNEG